MKFRLISPQQISKQSRDPKAGLKIISEFCKITWDYHSKTIIYNEISKLPILYTAPGAQKVKNLYNSINNEIPLKSYIANKSSLQNKEDTKNCTDLKCLRCNIITFKDIKFTLPNSNVSKVTQELLKWHERLAHNNFDVLQQLAREGYLPIEIATCEKPICASCQIGKAHKRDNIQG